MKAWQAYLLGLRHLCQFPKIWFWYYLVNLILGGIVAVSLFQGLNARTGSSYVWEQLMEGFDFRVWSDILVHYGGVFSGVLPQLIIFAFVYLGLVAFMQGGTLYFYTRPQVPFDRAVFWNNSRRYGGQILRIVLLFMALQLVCLVLMWWWFTYISKGFSTDLLQSELTIVYAAQWIGFPYLVFVFLIAMWRDYCKVMLIKEGIGVWAALKGSTVFCVKNRGVVLLLLLLSISTAVLLFFMFKGIQDLIPRSNFVWLLILFLMNQLFVFCRIGSKLWNLASCVTLTKCCSQ